MKSILLFLGITLLVSCSDLKRPEQRERLESIKTELGLLMDISNDIEIDSISFVMSEIMEVENRIKDNFQYDTLNIKLIESLDSYKRILPSLSFVVNARKTIDSSVAVRMRSLETLLSDIENSVGNRAKYNDFIDFEKDQVEQLSTFVNYCDSSSKESLKTFHNLHSSIESFSFKLKEENQEQ